MGAQHEEYHLSEKERSAFAELEAQLRAGDPRFGRLLDGVPVHVGWMLAVAMFACAATAAFLAYTTNVWFAFNGVAVMGVGSGLVLRRLTTARIARRMGGPRPPSNGGAGPTSTLN